MSQIASVDFPTKRIFLHGDTVTNGFDTMLAYFELMSMIASTPLYQSFSIPQTAEGNIPKGQGKYTPQYVLSATGWRYVPYSGVSHVLRVLVEPVSLDGLSGRDVFDRSSLTHKVEIDEVYEKVEIREVATGSGVNAQDVTDIANAVESQLSGDLSLINTNIGSIPSVTESSITSAINSNFSINSILLSSTAIHKSIFNKRSWDKVNNQLIIYEDDGTTIAYRFDTNNELSEVTPV